MTDANGNELVKVRSLTQVKAGLAILVLGLVGLVGLAILQFDTRSAQRQDRIVINRFKRSPCTGLTVVECRRLLITPEYLARVLRSPRFESALRDANRRARIANRPKAPRRSASSGRPPSGQTGGGTPSDPRSPTNVAQPQPEPQPQAQPQPPPEPSRPSPAPLLPELPALGACVTTSLVGVCLP